MPQLKRRHFFQLVGSAIATVSLNSCKTRKQPHPLDPNLPRSRQSSSRQLALLVGINNYPPKNHIHHLDGCLTDVMTLIFPNQWAADGEVARVEAGQTLLIPDPNRDRFNLQTQEPPGVTEVLIIASVTPLQTALKAMQAIASHRNQLSGTVSLADPLEVIDNLLCDLAQSDAKARNNSIAPTQQIHHVFTTKLAAMSMTFEVI